MNCAAMPERDTLLADQVGLAIASNPYLNRRNLRFEMAEGKVTLQGQVTTYFQKQMAQEALRKIAGVKAIENQLEVTWS